MRNTNKICTVTAFALHKKKQSVFVSNTPVLRNTNRHEEKEKGISGRLTENCVM
jgi:hypothetical protein